MSTVDGTPADDQGPGSPGVGATAPLPKTASDFTLPHDIYKVHAVSRLASQLGLAIGNPWQSLTVGTDIRHISEQLGVLCNEQIRFAPHSDVPAAQQINVYSTVPRRFSAPKWANRRHPMFAPLPTEDYIARSADFNVLTMREAYICHFLDAPVVIAADGKTVVSDYSSNYSGLVHFHPHPLRDCLADARYIDGIVVPIADDVQAANFCHWLVDWLPRLAFLGRRIHDPDVFIVTAEISAEFQRETMRLLGVTADRIIPLRNFEAVRARELLVPSNLREIGHPALSASPWALSYLQSTLGMAALRYSDAGREGRRLYISRSDARHRRVTNEPELVARLASAGYRKTVLSSMPLVDQIATIARADRLIGLHGAGLTHTVFMPPDARFLEILPGSYGIPTFYALAAGQGLRYLSYVADRIVPGPDRSLDDVEIDARDFETVCRSFYD